MKLKNIGFSWITFSLLTACGGGGSSDSSTSPPGAASVNVAAAWNNLLTTTASWRTTGRGADGKNYELSYSIAPGVDGVFQLTGASGSTSIQESSVTINGNMEFSGRQTLYFHTNGYNNSELLGIDYGDGQCSFTPIFASPIPGVMPIGSSSGFQTSLDYASCTTPGDPISRTGNTWSIESDGNVTLFCITSVTMDLADTLIAKEQDCVEADLNGNLLAKARIKIYTSESSAIVTKNY